MPRVTGVYGVSDIIASHQATLFKKKIFDVIFSLFCFEMPSSVTIAIIGHVGTVYFNIQRIKDGIPRRKS